VAAADEMSDVLDHGLCSPKSAPSLVGESRSRKVRQAPHNTFKFEMEQKYRFGILIPISM